MTEPTNTATLLQAMTEDRDRLIQTVNSLHAQIDRLRATIDAVRQLAQS